MPENMNKYKDAYISEARDHIKQMNKALLALEKNPRQLTYLREIFRHVHTLKSMAATMGYQQTMTLCHALEDMLDEVKQKKLNVKLCANLLFESFDMLERLVRCVKEDKPELDAVPLLSKLKQRLNNPTQEGDVLGENMLADDPAIEKVRAIEVKVEKLDALMNLAEELLINKMQFDNLSAAINNPALTAATDQLGRLVSEIQFNVMQSRLVPIDFVFERFPRMVRDLAKQQHKQINLNTVGGDIEFDRGIIDEIGESLVHILRNVVDHGIETPDVRKKLGKPSEATIQLKVTRTKNSVIIDVIDDGAGLDLKAIRAKALKSGLLVDAASDADIEQLIFSGMSTSKQVSEISGRGFGLNIVKNKISSLGGSIKVFSEANKQTRFTLEVPLTLAVINALFVSVGEKQYAIPLSAIERLVTNDQSAIKGFLDHEAIVLDEQYQH